MTTLDIAVVPVTADLSPEALGEMVAAALAAVGGKDTKVVSVKEVTLQDGVTQATETVVDWVIQGLPLTTLNLDVRRDDQEISVTVTWSNVLGGDRAAQKVDETAYSLHFD